MNLLPPSLFSLTKTFLVLVLLSSAIFAQTKENKTATPDPSTPTADLAFAKDTAGISAVVKRDTATNKVMIVSVLPNGPAEKAGLRGNDFIVKVDGQAVNGTNLRQAVSLLIGKPDTKVTVTITRAALPAPKNFVVTREIIKLKEVPSH